MSGTIGHVSHPVRGIDLNADLGELPELGLPGSVFLSQAASAGRRTHREGFPDRAYTPEGTLVPRTEEGAEAVESATRVRRELEAAGFSLRPFVHR